MENSKVDLTTLPALDKGGVSGPASLNLSDEYWHRVFVDKMIFEISELANDIFHPEKDPEVLWKEFRSQLSQWKRQHIISYEKYLESDDNSVLPESEISKWRRSQADR
jgi:hypothetical protein